MNIILLRGLVREKKHWGSFVEELKEAFPKANIITPEIQGVGEYVDTVSPSNFVDMVKFMQKEWSDNSVSVTAYYTKEDLPELKKYVEDNFSISRLTDQYIDLYKKLIDGETLHEQSPTWKLDTPPEDLLDF